MKKGFTLIELMSSILILGVITLIGVGTYTKVSENIKEKQYENKVSYIESQAALFASDTGYLSTNVNHLVELGYVEADNEDGEVISPVDNKVMNDYVITISKDGDIYYGNFTDKEEADLDKIDMTNENLEIIVTSTSGSVIAINKWSKENVTLTANIKNNTINKNDVQKIIWYSNTDTKEVSVSNDFLSVNKYAIEVSQIMNTGYRVEVIFKDGTKYEARRTIKIDKQKPNVYGEDVRVENADVYTQTNKTTRLIASDQNGSGIAGYYIGTNTTCTSNAYYVSGDERYETNLGNGTYYACVKDKVGNVSERISFTVEKVDSTAPTCEIIVEGTKGENDWYISDVEFSVSGTDNESGIKNTDISSKKLSSDNKNYTVTGTVRDKAGNTGTCSVTVKRDVTKPSCNVDVTGTKGENNWYITNVSFSASGIDETSGIKSKTVSSSSLTSDTSSYKVTGTVVDNAGNTKTCDATVKRDATKPSCSVDVSGTKGENDWYITNVSFSASGTDGTSGIKSRNVSSSSLTTDTSSYKVTGTVIDNAGNTKTCDATVKRDVTKPSCSWNDASYKDNWTKNNRTVTVTCNDTTSNCSSSASTNSWAYTSGTHKKESLSYTIKDNAGNTKTCSKDANVYVDKNAPTKPTSGAIGAVSGSSTSGSIKTSASGSTDSGSGVKEYRYLVTNSSTTPTDKSKFTTSKSFTRSCGTSYYAWAIAVDNVGNMSSVKSLGNTSDGANSYSAWGTCSKKCGGGTQTRTNTCALKTDLSQSCNTQECCSKTTAGTPSYGAWGSCSASCGGGTQSRTVTTPYTSDYDGSSCGSTSSTESQSCNTHSCLPANTCKIRGTTLRSTSTWTCSHGHSQTQYYQVYCTDAYGNVSAATSSPTRVCSVSPYGAESGWTVIPD